MGEWGEIYTRGREREDEGQGVNGEIEKGREEREWREMLCIGLLCQVQIEERAHYLDLAIPLTI